MSRANGRLARSLLPDVREHRLSGNSLAPGSRRVLCVLLTIGIVMLSPGAPQFVAAQVGVDSFREATADLGELMQSLRDVRAQIDRSQIDIVELSLDLAFEDPESLNTWVQDSIAYEPYSGLLRGAQGTLIAQAGNALDQSVLLATLIGNAGYDTRVATGQLTHDQALLLLQQSMSDGSTLQNAVSAPLVDQWIDRYAGRTSLESETQDAGVLETLGAAELDAVVDLMTESLLSSLQDAGVSLGSDTIINELIDDAQQYAWVEYRLSSSEDWIPLHPAAGVAPDVSNIAVLDVYEQTIPEIAQHRIRVQAFIERRLGAELIAAPIMDPWEVPAANIALADLAFTVSPSWEEVVPSDEQLAQGMFLPYWDGGIPAGAVAFDLLGNLVPPDAASSPFAGIFQTASRATSAAAGAIGGLGAGEDPQNRTGSSLEAVWLEITLVSPGGSEEQYRHMIVTREQGMTDRELVERFTGLQSVAVAVSTVAEVYLLDRLIEWTLGLEAPIGLLLADAYGVTDLPPIDGDAVEAALQNSFHPLTLFAWFQSGIDKSAGLRTFRSRPAVLVYERPDSIESFGESINIVYSDWRVMQIGESGLVVHPDRLLRQGVHEAFVESIYLESVTGEETYSTVNEFSNGPTDGQFVVVSSPTDSVLAALTLPEGLIEQVRQDLESGFVVVLPPTPKPESPAWWRVDPVSGRTLGMIASGRGGASVVRGEGSAQRGHQMNSDPAELLAIETSQGLIIRMPASLVVRIQAQKWGTLLVCALIPAIVGMLVLSAGAGMTYAIGLAFGPVAGVFAASLFTLIRDLLLRTIPPVRPGPERAAWMQKCAQVMLTRVI